MLKIQVKKGKDINDAVDELASALDLAQFYLRNPKFAIDDMVYKIIDEAMDYCEEVDVPTNKQIQ